MSRRIIDMRNRPAFLADFYGARPGTAAYNAAKWLNRRVGAKDDEHFRRSYDLEGFVSEIREAGITRAVVVGRDTPDLSIPNDTIHQITAAHEELVGVASVDSQTQGTKGAVAEIDRAVNRLGLKAVNCEPGFGKPALRADDVSLRPVYDACAQLGVPVFIMSGPTTPDLDDNDPVAIGRVAREFPKLRIICSYGFYPRVNEIVGVAFRYENVSVSPDMYFFLHGSRLYIEAANAFMRNQLLFGTSYPFRPMKQTIDDFLALGLNDEVLDDVLFNNANRMAELAL